MKRIGERERERKSGGKNLVGMISLALPSCFIHHHSHRDKIGLVSFSSLGSLYRGHSMNSKEILFSFHYNLCVRAPSKTNFLGTVESRFLLTEFVFHFIFLC